MGKKLISVCVPVFNEQENIEKAYERITAVMSGMGRYDYEIVFFNDGSTDGSGEAIEKLCETDAHVRAVFYERNFGYAKTVFYCMQQAKGDAAMLIHCDLQNPPELIPDFVEKWEKGADAVIGVKSKSRENKLMYFLRTLGYYIIFNFIFGMRLIPHATEFELLDKSIIKLLGGVSTQNPFLRGYILEYAKNPEKIYYTQDKRIRGKSHFRFNNLYDFSIGGIVSMSKCLPRRFIAVSAVGLVLLLAEFFINFLPKCFEMESALFWNSLLIRIGLLALLLLTMLVSVVFEYVIIAVKNTEQKPFVVEEKRINY